MCSDSVFNICARIVIDDTSNRLTPANDGFADDPISVALGSAADQV